MLALLPDDYKPDFILGGLFLRRLPIDVWSYLLREVSDPPALALKANELYQSRVSSSMNLLSEILEDSLQVNAVISRSRLPNLLYPRDLPPQLHPQDLQLLWDHVGFLHKAVNCRKPCLISENY